MKKAIPRYVPPTRYTPEQLLDASIVDLESDIASAIRDHGEVGEWVQYIEDCRARLATLRAKKNVPQ